MYIRDEFKERAKVHVVLIPPNYSFYCILLTYFREFSKFVALIQAVSSNNSPKFPKQILKFVQVFKIKKPIFVPNIRNHYIDQSLTQVSTKTQGKCQFFHRTLSFLKFRVLWRRKFLDLHL